MVRPSKATKTRKGQMASSSTPRSSASSSVTTRTTNGNTSSNETRSSCSSVESPTSNPSLRTPADSPAMLRTPPSNALASGSSHSASTPDPGLPALTPRVPRPRNAGAEHTRRILEPLCIDNQMQDINLVPESQNNDVLAKIQEFMAKQSQELRDLRETLRNQEQERENAPCPKKRRLSRVLTAHVREVYKDLSHDSENGTTRLKWDLSKTFDDDANFAVNKAVLEGVRSTDSKTSSTTIKAAIRVHFRTKKREHHAKANDMQEDILTKQRKRSRINTKASLRKSSLLESSSITEELKNRYSAVMTAEYMSSEHTQSSEEDGPLDGPLPEGSSGEEEKPKVLIKHRLPWRSDEINNVMNNLERRVRKRRGPKGQNMMYERKVGGDSVRHPPIDAPHWAVRRQAVPPLPV